MRRRERIPIHDHSGFDAGGLVAQSTIVTLVNGSSSPSSSTSAPPVAADVAVADTAGNFTAGNVEDVLAELAAGSTGIPDTIVDAKGDLIVATAADTVARLAVGADTYVLTADSGEASGLKWAAPGAGSGDPTGQIVAIWDGGGAVVAAGSKVDVVAPYAGTITGWTILADQSGSATVDVWSDVYASYPPTDADSITASATPALSSATKAASTTLTGWDTTITAGDIIRFNVDSATTVQRLVLVLDYTRT